MTFHPETGQQVLQLCNENASAGLLAGSPVAFPPLVFNEVTSLKILAVKLMILSRQNVWL